MQANKDYDCIIVGQGIAGTFIAYQYSIRGKNILVINSEESMTSSRVAAGIINPVTGRQFVKSWMFDELWAYLIPFYQDMEQFLNTVFFHRTSIFRSLPTAKEFNDWSVRSESRDILKVLASNADISKFGSFLKLPEYYTAFNGGRLDTNVLLDKMRSYLQSKNAYISETFDYERLITNNDFVSYKNYTAGKIIFCEGYRGKDNPYFRIEGFNPFRGDVFEVRTDGIHTNDIIKNELFFVPTGSDLLWVGTANSYNKPGSKSKETVINEMRDKLSDLLTGEYHIVSEKGAFRPAVKDRRPLLGRSNIGDNVYIFNGLGSKGASLGPYFSQQLYDYIENSGYLTADVDIKRYYDI